MPRRGSRAQLIHLLADRDAFIWRRFAGDAHVYPRDFYDNYSHFTLTELREITERLTPAKVGRPGSRYSALLPKVIGVLSRTDLSVRAACKHVADKHGVNEHALRNLYRARAKR